MSSEAVIGSTDDAEGPDLPGSARVEAFSDGVIAVIITIMALDLHAPLASTFTASGDRGLVGRFPALFVYILSFVFIGIYWNNHHHLFHRTDRVSGAVMWANLHLLFWLSLIPVVTEWIGAQYRHHLPAAVWGIVAVGAAFAFTLLVHAIEAATGGKASKVAIARQGSIKDRLSIIVYVIGIAASFLSPYAGYACYVLVAGMWFIPDRRMMR